MSEHRSERQLTGSEQRAAAILHDERSREEQVV